MTLEQLEYQIGEIALKNNLVNAYFAGGSLYELNAEVINEYPVIFLTPAGDHTVKENTTRFSLTIYYVDRLWDDDRNETDICSAAIETLKNIMRQINYLDWVAYVEDEPVIRLFTETERMSDRVAGAYMNVWVETLNASTCPEFLDELGRPMGNYIPGNINVLDAYATKAWVIMQKYADKPWVLEQIANIQLSGGTTQKQVLEMIASALTEYTKTENFATINSSAITNGGDLQVVDRSEFNNYSAMTAEELERIIELIGNIPMSSVTENITVLSSVTSSHTEDIRALSAITSSHTQDIISLSANTSALTENLAVLSAYTHDSVSSLTHSVETLSAATETAISGLSDSITQLSASTVNIENNMTALTASVLEISGNTYAVYDLNEIRALPTDEERQAVRREMIALDAAGRVVILKLMRSDGVVLFQRMEIDSNSGRIVFFGYYRGRNAQAIFNGGSLSYSFNDIYSLPTASSTTKGGIKVGSGLTISGEVLSTQYQIWVGTQAQYDALASYDSMTFYVITGLN